MTVAGLQVLSDGENFTSGRQKVIHEFFYFCRGWKWGWLPELLGLLYLNGVVLAGEELTAFGVTFPEQGLAVLALVPILCYRGRQGPHSRAIQYACYAFYPVHMLILFLAQRALR